MNITRSALLAVAVGSIIGCASGPHPWSREEVCSIKKAPNVVIDDYETWIQLLLRGYDRQTHRATAPAVDCTGMQVKWDQPALSCTDSTAARTQLPDRPLTEADVVVNQFGPDIRLVWVITNRFASGDGLGPAAVVEIRPNDVLVRAIGPLRANIQRVKMRLEPIGKTEVLVAEGEQCATKEQSSCSRGVRIMPYQSGRFLPEIIMGDNSEGEACLQPAWFFLQREEQSKLDSGWRRRFRLTASLAFDPKALTVQELLTVHDLDPRNPSTPPQLYRTAHSDEIVKYFNGRLVADKAPLWTKMTAVLKE